MITFIIVTLFLSALFSGTEIAFITANRLNIELKRSQGDKRGQLLSKFYQYASDFLGTTLVGNNIALVIFGLLMTELLDPKVAAYLPEIFNGDTTKLLTITIITTLVVLIFGEFLPKILFRLNADRVLFFLAYPLLIFIVLWPIAWLMVEISNFFMRLILGHPIEDKEHVFTRQDLEHFIQTVETDKEEELDKELFERALQLTKVKIRDCMIPRTEIVGIDINEDVEDLRKVFLESKFSKIVIFKESIDDIVGYVHHQKMLQERPKNIASIMLDIPVVPEAARAYDLMNKFIKDRISMACVVDEFGGTSGIVTLEDILEEIFGQIVDEHDGEEHVEEIISNEEYLFSGRLEIDYLNEKYESLNLPDGEYHTLSGYIVSCTGNIPEQGQEITLKNHKFILEQVSDTKIETIRVLLPIKDKPSKELEEEQ